MRMRLTAVAIAGLIFASCADRGPQQSDQMIDVGTHHLYIHREGTGKPTVVIDVGVASRSEDWRPIQSRLAEKTCVCTYDRAGYGRSEPGSFPRHCGKAADELRTLLRGASVPRPYVLVGHSLGALTMQVYADRYAEDVAGVVLLDPPPLSWMLGESYPDLSSLADQLTNEWQAMADRKSESPDPQEKAEAAFYRTIASEHREMFGESARLAASIGTLGDIPLVIVASDVPNPMFGHVADEYQRYWIEQSRLLANKSMRGKFMVANGSSHQLHVDAPDLVVESILSIVSKVREY